MHFPLNSSSPSSYRDRDSDRNQRGHNNDGHRSSLSSCYSSGIADRSMAHSISAASSSSAKTCCRSSKTLAPEDNYSRAPSAAAAAATTHDGAHAHGDQRKRPKEVHLLQQQQQKGYDDNLLQLALMKEWSTIRDILRKSSKERGYALYNQIQKPNNVIANDDRHIDTNSSSSSNSNSNTCDGLSCFAVAVGLNAPLDVIVAMLDKDPTMATICDEFGATPLHLGCLNGASFGCIAYLARHYPGLVKQVDNDRKNVLHCYLEFACLAHHTTTNQPSSSGSGGDSNNVGARGAVAHESYSDYSGVNSLEYVNVVKVLCDVAPEIVRAQDNFGLTPMDVVQHFKADAIPGSNEHQRLDEMYQVLNKVNIRLYFEEQNQIADLKKSK